MTLKCLLNPWRFKSKKYEATFKIRLPINDCKTSEYLYSTI
ncbi:hypothetical protein SERMPA_00058 (plasmid) [Serratia marcescens]